MSLSFYKLIRLDVLSLSLVGVETVIFADDCVQLQVAERRAFFR